ncbi:discoidin domain-containing protein [Streptomyces hoynatensis]|uniref:Glycosyl hydrolase family protein n=1 Tax=Streptomyces hoynatensis TaxID=1141874 RepID=A0A3A9ZEC8_9ACTN|nr:discoidin domain-containing protein [Streptomyces hoynatensis]RKN46720.1 glycosyl hydrolase family protein [Streptomyces hoynatensis]
MFRRRTRARTRVVTALAALLLAVTGTGLEAAAAPAGPALAAAEWNTDWAAAAYAADPAAVSASGVENAGTAAGLAFDGNGGTRWSSNFADDAWISVDLGTAIRVTEVRLAWEAAYGRRYAVEVSADGRDWHSFSTENAGTGGTVDLHTYPQEAVGRYVRVRGIERATPYGYSLYSFEVYGGVPAPASTGRANLALHHPAFTNYYQDAGHSPAYVTDGGIPADLRADQSRWASDWNADRWVSVDLGATAQIDTVDLYWQAAYAVDYRLQVSDDNRSWRTVYQPTASEVAARRADVRSPGEASGLHDTVRLSAPATGRYVRMLGVERRSFYNPAPATAQFGYSLYEFQVWGTGGSDAAAYPALPQDSGAAYRTTFLDEFDGTALNRDRWRVVTTGSTMGTVNGESQAYVDSPQNIAVADGTLRLRANYCARCTTAPNGQVFDFSSGRIDTNTRFDFTYGRVSARLRLPVGEGFWPAFWLLGSNVDDPAVSWPASGEADIMENIGYADWSSSGVHGPGYSADGNIGVTQHFPAGQSADQWHTYAVEWTPTAQRYYVDDRQVFELTRQKVEATRGQWVFDHNHYVILNLALGGAYPAGYNGVTQPYWGLPQSSVDRIAAGGVQLEVDWVRVEQRL